MALADLQSWLNAHGASLTVDGLAGPKTRAAIIDTFRNTNAPSVGGSDIAKLAVRLGCTARQIRAVSRVESRGGGWDRAGLLKCLWERHYLWRRVRFTIPGLSNPRPGGYTTDADRDGINDSWERLADSALRFPKLAFECASFGKFQIMGAHWKALHYPSAWEFVWRLSRSEAAHYEALARYIEANNMQRAIQSISADPMDCLAFSDGYNGRGGRARGYPGKIARAFEAEGRA